MTLFELASVVLGIIMGFWLDRIVEMGRSNLVLAAGAVALGLGVAFGQQWCGMALGCVLGARVLALKPSAR